MQNIQDEIQSVYRDAMTSTLYTAMVYYNEECEQGTEVHSEPYVVISSYKNHDKYADVVFSAMI